MFGNDLKKKTEYIKYFADKIGFNTYFVDGGYTHKTHFNIIFTHRLCGTPTKKLSWNSFKQRGITRPILNLYEYKFKTTYCFNCNRKAMILNGLVPYLYTLDHALVDVNNYKGYMEQSKFKCLRCGFIYETSLNLMLTNMREETFPCPECGLTYDCGFDVSKSAILYIAEILDTSFYKVGITNRTLEQRYTNDVLNMFGNVKQWKYSWKWGGRDAKNDETRIKNICYPYRVWGNQVLKGVGNSEIFNCNVPLVAEQLFETGIVVNWF